MWPHYSPPTPAPGEDPSALVATIEPETDAQQTLAPEIPADAGQKTLDPYEDFASLAGEHAFAGTAPRRRSNRPSSGPATAAGSPPSTVEPSDPLSTQPGQAHVEPTPPDPSFTDAATPATSEPELHFPGLSDSGEPSWPIGERRSFARQARKPLPAALQAAVASNVAQADPGESASQPVASRQPPEPTEALLGGAGASTEAGKEPANRQEARHHTPLRLGDRHRRALRRGGRRRSRHRCASAARSLNPGCQLVLRTKPRQTTWCSEPATSRPLGTCPRPGSPPARTGSASALVTPSDRSFMAHRTSGMRRRPQQPQRRVDGVWWHRNRRGLHTGNRRGPAGRFVAGRRRGCLPLQRRSGEHGSGGDALAHRGAGRESLHQPFLVGSFAGRAAAGFARLSVRVATAVAGPAREPAGLGHGHGRHRYGPEHRAPVPFRGHFIRCRSRPGVIRDLVQACTPPAQPRPGAARRPGDTG